MLIDMSKFASAHKNNSVLFIINIVAQVFSCVSINLVPIVVGVADYLYSFNTEKTNCVSVDINKFYKSWKVTAFEPDFIFILY